MISSLARHAHSPQARLYGKLASTADANKKEWIGAAEQAWQELIDQNPDCHDYYKAFLANAGVDFGSALDIDLFRRHLMPFKTA